MQPDRYEFAPVTRDDLPLMASWLSQPHVTRWFGDAEARLRWITDVLDDAAVEAFLVRHEDRPIGYIQIYDPVAEKNHPYADQPAGTYGIDQFIGKAELIGRGHGPRFIDIFVRNRFAAGVRRVVTDPDTGNAVAIRAYRKAGFAPVEERTLPWGHVLLMARDRTQDNDD
jgi:aminoglycoside 6'-N-acetyltransferase